VASPIDGRVADINRRVDDARHAAESQGETLGVRIDEVAQSLGSYAQSTTEATAHIGLDLRRLGDELQGIQQLIRDVHGVSFEEYYQERLAHARDLPLERLDEPIAALINHASGHRGFAAQGGLWFNWPIAVALGAGAAALAVVNERIVEIPFAMSALSRVPPPARVLDIGSAESMLPLSAASLGYRVVALDPRPIGYSHPNLKSHTLRLEDWSAPGESFSIAFLISTIEHIGLGAYGEAAYGSPEHGTGADRQMLDRVRQLLVPEGLLVLTTPYGTRTVNELERTYDDEALARLLEGWEILERRIVLRRDALVWELAEQIASGERGVAMLVASPKHPA
jgi:hypothetical protein